MGHHGRRLHGSVGHTTFSGIEHLAGATGNDDTFVVHPGGSVTDVAGGDGGYDTLSVDGAGSVVSHPTSGSAGALVIDGTSVGYSGLEPVSISGVTDVTVSPGDGVIPALPGDIIRIAPGVTAGTIDVSSETASMETHAITIAGLTSLNIDVISSHDTVRFVGNLVLPGVNITVHARQILVDSGATIDTRDAGGDGTLTFTADSENDPAVLISNFATAADSGLLAVLAAAAAALGTASGYYQQPDAKIVVDGATIHAGTITMTATSTANMSHAGTDLIQVNVINGHAEVALINGSASAAPAQSR